MRREVRAGGFTLLEIIVAVALMSILAGATAPFVAQQVQGRRVRVTQERMQAVVHAMTGHPEAGDHGYLADLGELPPALLDLNQRGAKPVYAVDPGDAIGAGYNGPYVANPGAAALLDAWGTPLLYAAGTAQVGSAGADRVAGTADDLVFPVAPAPTTGDLAVSVTGIPNDGGAACLLGEDEADVFVSLSQSGVRIERQLTGVVGAAGPFVDNGLHRGLHGLRAVGQGDWAGVGVRDVVEIRSGSAWQRITLAQPAGPAPGCGGGP